MWHLQASRRELIEICLGTSPDHPRLRETPDVVEHSLSQSVIHLYWDRQPKQAFDLPMLVILPDDQVSEILTAIGAIPQVPSPFSSLCRVMTATEAKGLFSAARVRPNRGGAVLAAAVAMIEAVLLSEGRFLLAQLSPAACRRTFAYAWGKALATGVPTTSIDDLLPRWLQTHALINGQAVNDSLRDTLKSSAIVLRACAALGIGTTPEGPAGRLAYAVYSRDINAQEEAWRSLTTGLDSNISLAALAALTRDERGTYLQEALRKVRSTEDDSIFSMCAFLATQVAPGSLQHLELLLSTRQPAIALWYGLFTVLQSPIELLAIEGGLGFRLMRDMTHIENPASHPIADVGYAEFTAIARLGVDTISRKLGHVSEVEVELVPLVTASFSYTTRNARSRQANHGQQLSLDAERGFAHVPDPAYKERLTQILSALSKLVHELPDGPNRDSPPDHKGRKR
jgi:hypothetical protein